MNSKQESKLSMYHTLLRHFEENEILVKTIVPFENAIADLKTTVTAIDTMVQQQMKSTTGATISKIEAKASLVELTLKMASALYTYAVDTRNNILKEAARVRNADLSRCRDEELGPKCRNILLLAQAEGNELEPYGVAATAIAALQTAADSYAATVTGPRHAIGQRAAYRKSLEALYRKANAILKDRIDRFMPRFAAANPEFVNTFVSDRSAVKPYTTVTQLRGRVVNGQTQKPIRGVSIELAELGVSFQSTSTGGFMVKPLQRGTYTLRISKSGFEPLIIKEVDISLGQLNRLLVTLVPVAEEGS